jgi:Ca2+-binding EF-hand superfamily protein
MNHLNLSIMKKLLVSLGIALMVSSSMVFAQDQNNLEQRVREAFKSILQQTDKNKDGKISLDEYCAIWKDKNSAEKKFKTWDVNKDGYLTEEEYVKVIMDMGKKK